MNYFSNKKRSLKNNKGFLLAELVVALFIFSLFMTISIGSIISLLDANRKTQSMKSVMNNLNLALDSMTKEMAVGKNYHCGFLEPITEPADCSFSTGGGDRVTFLANEDVNGDGNFDDDDLITYSFHPPDEESDTGYLVRTISQSTGGFVRMTAEEVDITNVNFFVDGTTRYENGDYFQPRVVIWVDGKTKARPRGTETSFHVQTAVTQRVPDNLVGDSL